MSAPSFTAQGPRVIRLRSSRSANEPWRLRIDGELLSLSPSDSPPVLTIDNTQAPYCMCINRNAFGRLTVRFTIVPGIREHTFTCGRSEMEHVLNWLPQKPRSEVKADLSRSAMGLVLFAALHIALAQWVEPTAGLILLAAAAAGFFWVCTTAHALMGTALLIAGAIHLFQWHLIGSLDSTAEGIRLALGALFLIFCIQQFAMMSTNELLRSARRRADGLQDLAGTPRSELVQNVSKANLAAGLLLGAYAILALWMNGADHHPWQIGRVALPPFLSNIDATIGAILALVCLASAAILPRFRKPAYAEARITVQFLVGIVVLVTWGLAASFRIDMPLAFLDGVLANGASAFQTPYAWGLLIVAVLAANRFFARSVDRELDHARL